MAAILMRRHMETGDLIMVSGANVNRPAPTPTSQGRSVNVPQEFQLALTINGCSWRCSVTVFMPIPNRLCTCSIDFLVVMTDGHCYGQFWSWPR